MDEIKTISDRVSVMRDGEYIGTVRTNETTKDEIVKMMVGRVIYGDKKEKSNVADSAPVVLDVRNLNCGNEVRNISFNLKRGEILGFAGLMGAGRTETARAIFGADKKNSGEIYINGKKVNIKTPEEAVKNNIFGTYNVACLACKYEAEKFVLVSTDIILYLTYAARERKAKRGE